MQRLNMAGRQMRPPVPAGVELRRPAPVAGDSARTFAGPTPTNGFFSFRRNSYGRPGGNPPWTPNASPSSAGSRRRNASYRNWLRTKPCRPSSARRRWT